MRNEYHRQGLLEIGGIVASVLEALGRAAAPGVTTAWLDSQAGRLLDDMGAESTSAREFGFPGRLCISINDEVAHGVPGDRALREGDLIKMDLTAGRRGYVADATRMVLLRPASTLAAELEACAREACFAAIAAAGVGVRLSALGAAVDAVVMDRGFKVIREMRGHGIGRRTHEGPEVPNFDDSENDGVLRKGMVIAIEPIVCAGNGEVRDTGDGWTVATADGALAAHYEETVIIGEDGPEVATVC